MESQRPARKRKLSSYPTIGDGFPPHKKAKVFAGLTCSICQNSPKSIYVFECQHFTCHSCIHHLFSQTGSYKFLCAQCRRFLSARERQEIYENLKEEGHALAYNLFLTELEKQALDMPWYNSSLVKSWQEMPDEIDLRVKDMRGNSLLHRALHVQHRNYDCSAIQELTKHTSVNEPNKEGETPLAACMASMRLAHFNKYSEATTATISAAKILLQEGASPNPEAERPLLNMAAAYGDHELVKDFLKCGAAVSSRDTNGRTALHGAKTPRIAKTLLKHVDHLNTVDNDGLPPWAMNVILQNIATARFLQSQGATIGAYVSQGEDLLSRSIEDAEKLSISTYEPRVNYLTSLPAWHQQFDVPAAMKKCIDNNLPDILQTVVSAAIDDGCPVNSWCDQYHLLNLTVKENNFHMTHTLVATGASPYVRGTDNLNCIELARNNGNSLIEHVLNQASNISQACRKKTEVDDVEEMDCS